MWLVKFAMQIQSIPKFYNSPQQSCQTPAFGYSRTALGREIDVFVKSETHSVSAAEKLLAALTDFLSKVDVKHKLGEGFRGVVFKIDDKYVLKADKTLGFYPGTLVETADSGFKALKTYFGKPVVEFTNKIQVLRNVSTNGHTTAGLSSYNDTGMLMSEKFAYWNETYLPRFSALPQKSFDALAKDFAELNKLSNNGKFYAFDTKNPNNFVLTGKNTLRIVDDIDTVQENNSNTIAGLLRVFLEKVDLDYKAPSDIMNQALRKELMKKIILAGEKYELPYLRTYPDMNTWRHVCEDFCEYRELTDGLARLRKEVPDTKIRLQKVDEFLENLLAYSYNPCY